MATKTNHSSFGLAQLGIYGYEAVEPVVFAALVTGDPLLLIGRCGTGKTQLLNSLSEALGLEHRHYNASLISFDDLVGFPYPSGEFKQIEYLQTPATVWQAESVLIDEISRCKPEHQNRLFSIVQERRIQGIRLEKLRYRWAAMNPFRMDQGGSDSYDGSEPLDQALADRFAFIVEVPDWGQFSRDTQRAIARAAEGEFPETVASAFRRRLGEWRSQFAQTAANPPDQIVEYALTAAGELAQARFRLSPRRVRQLVRNIAAVFAVRGASGREKSFQLALSWSLPHRAWGEAPSAQTIAAVHRTAYDAITATGRDRWLLGFHLEKRLSRRARMLAESCPDPDTGTLAIAQLLVSQPRPEAAAFAYALYPFALEGRLNIGSEGISDLGRLANAVMDVRGEVVRRHPLVRGSQPDDWDRLQGVLNGLSGKRRERAAQLFNFLMVDGNPPEDPVRLEEELEKCVRMLRRLQ